MTPAEQRDDCARRAYEAAAVVMCAQGETVAQWEAMTEGFPEVLEVWRAVADAIGPRCAHGTLWRKDGSVLNDGCTLPAWHDREKEPCR